LPTSRAPLDRGARRASGRAARHRAGFGRLGIWERDIPSGEGRWDKHVFNFWGIDPAAGTPHYRDAISASIPRTARLNLRRVDAARRPLLAALRVIHPDGRTRWIHSQWEVKNGPRGVPTARSA
jgi:hypothetical protein